MPKFDYPRLCGGTFFTLVLCALKERKKKREHYKGERDGLSEPEVLLALIKVINPNFVGVELDLIKTPTSRYKSCDISNNAYFPFNDSLLIEHFDQTVKQEYTRSLLLMEEFVQSYLDLSFVERGKCLVRALADLILQDNSIDLSEEFFISEDGSVVTKESLYNLKVVCLPAFLLGVWHYVVVKRKDNKVGKETYQSWCANTGEKYSNRKYVGQMGKGKFDNLIVSYNITKEIKMKVKEKTPLRSEIQEATLPSEIVTADKKNNCEYQSLKQTMNTKNVKNEFHFNQYGTNNTQIGNVGE